MNEKLNQLVRIAKNKSFFYHNLYKDIDSFEKAPFMFEKDAVDNCLSLNIDKLSRIVSKSYVKDFVRCYSQHSRQLFVETWIEKLALFKPLGKVLIVCGNKEKIALVEVIKDAVEICDGEVVYLLPGQPLSKGSQLINDPSISTIISTDKASLALGQYSHKVGLHPNLKQVITLGKENNKAINQRINKYFNCEMHHGLYIDECECLLGFDDGKDGYVIDDTCYIEIVDNDKNILGNGEYGKLCFTTINDDCQPLIRYKTNLFTRIRRDNGRVDYVTSSEMDNNLYRFEGLIDYYIDDKVNIVALSQIDEERLYREIGRYNNLEVNIKYVSDYITE